MKGPHDYSSPADWPLMMVCTKLNRGRLFLLGDAISTKHRNVPSLSTCLSLLSIPVLHGHVHRVRAVRGSLALLVCLLLEGSAADPVLDRCCHHPRHAGESCVLLRVPEHPVQRRLRLVDLIYLIVCEIIFFLSSIHYSLL